MLAIDMIKFLQVLDIPLKNWNQYVEPTGEFDLKGLLRDGQIRAYEKIGELQSCLKRLQLAERGIQDTEKYRDCGWILQERDTGTEYFKKRNQRRSVFCGNFTKS